MPRHLVPALVLFVATVAAHAAPPKVAFRGLGPGASIDEKTAATVSDALEADLRRAGVNLVASQKDVAAVLTFEQQKLLLGCNDDTCKVDLGGSLGADELLLGQLSKLGESWLVSMRRLDLSGKSLKGADRRLRGGTIDDVLDVMPALVAELYGVQAVPAPTTVKPPAPEVKVVPGWAEKAADVSAIRSRLKLVTDGGGRYLAFDPEAGSFDPFYAGDATKLFAQRVSGGGRSGDDFDLVFWEPRVNARWQASFGAKEGRFFLQCGDRKLSFLPVAAEETKRLVDAMHFFEPRWQRRAFAIARDDNARYFVVDQAREPDGNTDFRVFVGKRNQLAAYPVEDAMLDDEGTVLLLGDQKLRVDPRRNEAEWVDHGNKLPLRLLSLDSQVVFFYGQLGVYKGEQLGTACDGRL